MQSFPRVTTKNFGTELAQAASNNTWTTTNAKPSESMVSTPMTAVRAALDLVRWELELLTVELFGDRDI